MGRYANEGLRRVVWVGGKMINLDPYITTFVSNNWIALSIFLGAFKVVATMTSWVGDDKIYTLLSGIMNQAKRK